MEQNHEAFKENGKVERKIWTSGEGEEKVEEVGD